MEVRSHRRGAAPCSSAEYPTPAVFHKPKQSTVEVFILRGSSYALVGKFGPGDTVRSEVVAGFEMGVDDICPA